MVQRDVIWLVILVVYLITTHLTSTEAFPSQGFVSPERNDLFELSVIHLNDFHARFVQTNPDSLPCTKGSEDKCVGGIARVYTASRQLLNERPNAIFLNAGDNFFGTLWYEIYRWNVTARFMNMLPQDAMTLGNHEFDDGIAGVVPYLKESKVPVVSTNIDDREEPDIQGLYTNSTVIERNGTKIGIIGVTTPNTSILSSPENLRFLDEIETVNAEAERLKKRGINVIIVLSHCGLDVDKVMAASCPNVDLIVGGHSHSFLYSGTPPNSDVPVDTYPVVVTQKESNRTVLVVQAYAFTKYLGNITVWFNADGEVVDWEGNPILLDSSVKQDPEILAALAPWQVAIDAFNAKVIGYSRVRLDDNCRFGECNLGNLITDAMVEAYLDKSENETHWTYAAVACTNVGGIHAHSSAASGNITYADAVTHQQHDNTWDVLELRGSDLIQVLEYSVANSYAPDVFIGIQFLQWSGIRVVFNLENEAYSRVTCLKIRCRACEIPIYEDVALDEWYRIVVPYFLAQGGDGHTVLQNQKRNYKMGTLGIDHYVKYIEKMSPITIGVEGRMTLKGTWHG